MIIILVIITPVPVQYKTVYAYDNVYVISMTGEFSTLPDFNYFIFLINDLSHIFDNLEVCFMFFTTCFIRASYMNSLH